MVLRNPPSGRNRHHAPEGPTLNPHLKWGLQTVDKVRGSFLGFRLLKSKKILYFAGLFVSF